MIVTRLTCRLPGSWLFILNMADEVPLIDCMIRRGIKLEQEAVVLP